MAGYKGLTRLPSLLISTSAGWMAILSNTKYDVGPGPGLITITTTTIVTSAIMSWAVAGLAWAGTIRPLEVH